MQRTDEQRGEMPMAADRASHGSAGGPDPVRIIADSPLLRSASRSSLDDLRPALEWVALDESDVLFLGGDHGNALYFVAEGHLEIAIVAEQASSPGRKTQAVARITAGDVGGEMQTLTGSRQLATVTALTSARLVRLAKEGFDHYLATHPDVTTKLKSIFTPRFYRRQMLLVLNDMFGKMTPGMLVDIENRMTWRHVSREGTLFRQGESSDRLFVVVSGRLHILSADDGREAKIVEEISQGGTVGELGVFSDEAQSTSVVAVRDSVLLEFAHDNFRELAARYPALNEWLARLLSMRLSGVIRGVPAAQQNTNILLVPANDGAPLEDFARVFCESLARQATCLLVSSARADTELGATGISQAVEGDRLTSAIMRPISLAIKSILRSSSMRDAIFSSSLSSKTISRMPHASARQIRAISRG